MTRAEITEAINEQVIIVDNCTALLKSKDYIGTKIAMGVSKKSDYTEEIAQTEVWRSELRAAEAEIERLQALEPEDDGAQTDE